MENGMESELLLLAREIDGKIKFMESKLEKPYMIGFNHSSVPIQEAEQIVDDLLKVIDAEIEEQKEIDVFLDEEINECVTANKECSNFLANSQAQLQELEAHALSNIPGYRKFEPPKELPADDFQYGEIVGENNEMDQASEASGSPVVAQEEVRNLDEISEEPHTTETTSPQDEKNRQNLNEMLDNGIDDTFDQTSLLSEKDLFPNESQMSLVSSPIVDLNTKLIAKKLDFDQLTSDPRQKKPFACSTEKKNKTPVEVERKAIMKQVPEDIENISGIQDIGSTVKRKVTPTKPVRRILSERQPVNQSEPDGGGVKSEKGVSKSDEISARQLDQLLKGLPPSISNLLRDTWGKKPDLAARDTLGRKELPTGPRDVFTRDTLSTRWELPTGLRNASTRDTLSRRSILPADGFRRDTIGSRRDTLGIRSELPSGLRELPTGLRNGVERDTFNSNLPTGLRDAMHRDTLTGEIINNRRLSHYIPVPAKPRPLGTLPPSPKEPVLSEFAMKIINKYK